MSDIIAALSLVNDFLRDWNGLIIGITGIVISLIVFFYTRKKDKLNSLFEVFKYLNEDRHREARRVLYTQDNPKISPKDKVLSSHIILGFDAIAMDYPLVRVCEDIVRDDLNHMGLMLKRKLVPENEFLDRYSSTVLRCKEKLKYNIEKRRKVRSYRDYVKNIDYLFIKAQKYMEKYKQNTTED